MVESINILVTTDFCYLKHCFVLIRSIASHNKSNKINIYVGYRNLSREIIDYYLSKYINNENIEIIFVKAEALDSSELIIPKQLSEAAYYRVLLPNILYQKYGIHRLLYLDVDMLVEKDLSNLYYGTDLGNNLLGAVIDIPNVSSSRFQGKYFNSGLLLIDVKKYVDNHVGKKVIDYISTHKNIIFPDQDGLNVILKGKWKEIKPKYNQISDILYYNSYKQSYYSYEVFSEARKNPCIIHFAGSVKPWKIYSGHPLRNKYYYYLFKDNNYTLIDLLKFVLGNILYILFLNIYTKKITLFFIRLFNKNA